jgi:hypothetical protein
MWDLTSDTRKCSDPSSSPLWTNSVNCIPIVLQAYYCPFLQSSHRKVAKWVLSINFNVGCVAEGEGGVRWVCNNQMFPLVLLKKLYQKNFWITLVMLNKTVSIITRKGTKFEHLWWCLWDLCISYLTLIDSLQCETLII